MPGITQYRLNFDSRVEWDDAMLSKITGWMRLAADEVIRLLRTLKSTTLPDGLHSNL
jgi:hypothetical protein